MSLNLSMVHPFSNVGRLRCSVLLHLTHQNQQPRQILSLRFLGMWSDRVSGWVISVMAVVIVFSQGSEIKEIYRSL